MGSLDCRPSYWLRVMRAGDGWPADSGDARRWSAGSRGWRRSEVDAGVVGDAELQEVERVAGAEMHVLAGARWEKSTYEVGALGRAEDEAVQVSMGAGSRPWSEPMTMRRMTVEGKSTLCAGFRGPAHPGDVKRTLRPPHQRLAKLPRIR